MHYKNVYYDDGGGCDTDSDSITIKWGTIKNLKENNSPSKY